MLGGQVRNPRKACYNILFEYVQYKLPLQREAEFEKILRLTGIAHAHVKNTGQTRHNAEQQS
jgi:hypothetical protein